MRSDGPLFAFSLFTPTIINEVNKPALLTSKRFPHPPVAVGIQGHGRQSPIRAGVCVGVSDYVRRRLLGRPARQQGSYKPVQSFLSLVWDSEY